MRFVALAAIVALACDQSQPPEGEVVGSVALSLFEPSSTPPPGCVEVGRVAVPARELSLVERFTGHAIEEFSRAVSEQVSLLAADAIVPTSGQSHSDAAGSGERFVATAYRCPTGETEAGLEAETRETLRRVDGLDPGLYVERRQALERGPSHPYPPTPRSEH